jgi:hypothetical protein
VAVVLHLRQFWHSACRQPGRRNLSLAGSAPRPTRPPISLPHHRPHAHELVFLASARASWPSSSILGSSGARSAASLANTTSHQSSSTILSRQLAGTGRSLALRCGVQKKGEKCMLQAVSSVSDVSYVCCKCFM